MFQNYMRRLFWLILGVAVSSIGIAMMLQANVGLEPWSVLQQGMSLRTGMTYGTASAIAGAAAILTAVLFGESFGFGTIINIAGCAVIIDAIQAAHLIPQMHGLVSGIAMLIGGLELLALGTWLYMKSALGSGPRDALMVALARKFGRSAGVCRAVVDVLVTVIGFFLGGPVGVGTIISAVGLGPLINLNLQPRGSSPPRCIRRMRRKPLRKLPESGNSQAEGSVLLFSGMISIYSLSSSRRTRPTSRLPSHAAFPLLCPIIIPNALARHKLLFNL